MEAVGSGYFYILAIKEYKKWLKMVEKPIKNDKFLCLVKFGNGIII
jgi:hypothetical protein